LEPVHVKKILLRHVSEKETAEIIACIISDSDERQYHSDERDALHLKREIGRQPTDDGHGDKRTERSDDENAQQAAKVTPRWPAAGILHSPPNAHPECHEGKSRQCNDIKAERKTDLPAGRLIAMPDIKKCGGNNPRRA
jgi:hypothetical protein